MKVGIWSACQKHRRGFGGRDTYRPDTNFFSDGSGVINVNLVKLDGWELSGEPFEDGADESAWATPCCPEVEDGDLVPIDLITNWPQKKRVDSK